MAQPGSTKCYHCGAASQQNEFKYYKCHRCKKLFTLGSQGRQQGRTYGKKKIIDPTELQGLKMQCCKCGVKNNAPFKYYDNKSVLHPRFKCASCRFQFSKRIMGSGAERQLLHTSKPTPRFQKLQDETSNASDAMETSDEDFEFSNQLEASLIDYQIEAPHLTNPNDRGTQTLFENEPGVPSLQRADIILEDLMRIANFCNEVPIAKTVFENRVCMRGLERVDDISLELMRIANFYNDVPASSTMIVDGPCMLSLQ